MTEVALSMPAMLVVAPDAYVYLPLSASDPLYRRLPDK